MITIEIELSYLILISSTFMQSLSFFLVSDFLFSLSSFFLLLLFLFALSLLSLRLADLNHLASRLAPPACPCRRCFRRLASAVRPSWFLPSARSICPPRAVTGTPPSEGIALLAFYSCARLPCVSLAPSGHSDLRTKCQISPVDLHGKLWVAKVSAH